MDKPQKIHFIITGGTIDSVWSGSHDTVVVSEHSVLPEYFEELGRNLKFYEDFSFTEVCMNAQVFTPEEVAKNIEEGKFYSVFKDKQ